jgi:tetratricopeptide (TPR) repeat protein
MTSDPYAPHLRQADEFFSKGEIVKAGQIWQAILKQQPTHAKAREGLLAVKQRLLALREAEAAVAQAHSEPAPVAAPEPTENLEPAPPTPPPTPVEVSAASAAPAVPDESFSLPVPEPAPVEAPAPPPPSVLMKASPAPLMAPPPQLSGPESAPIPATTPASMPQVAHFLVPSLEGPLYPAPRRVVTGSLDPDRLVAEGCTLYDMGQLEDALRKWDQALVMDPAHALARSYANGARRELGLDLVQATAGTAPAQAENYPADVDVDKLLREAVPLYDMGLVEEAVP